MISINTTRCQIQTVICLSGTPCWLSRRLWCSEFKAVMSGGGGRAQGGYLWSVDVFITGSCCIICVVKLFIIVRLRGDTIDRVKCFRFEKVSIGGFVG